MDVGLEQTVRSIAQEFRGGASAAGNQRFQSFTEDLERVLSLGHPNLEQVLLVLRTALEQHSRGDYIGMADALEHELLPALAVR